MNTLSAIVQASKELALQETEQYATPSPFHLNLAYQVGQRLATELHADADVVAIGTYLMDCMLGLAVSENRIPDHVNMSAARAEQLLKTHADLDLDTKKNIIACVREHHGVPHFSTLESEIVCNADCYRFASVEGFIGGIHNFRKMELPDLVALCKIKVEEKWNALSLEICKKELTPQHRVIQQLLATF